MHTYWRLAWVFVLAIVLFTLPAVGGAWPLHTANSSEAATIITVDSGTDPDNSKSKDCSSNTPCTLRRAIVEARLLSPDERPVLIQFNIPATAEEGYDSALGVWEIELLASTDPSVFRTLEGGQITIDGATQPGGRLDGPKIVLIGPGTGNKDGIIVGTNNAGAHDDNVLRGLAFQNFKTHVIVNSNDNLITENWFGLTSDGMQPYLRNGDAQDGSGSAGVALSANIIGNEITENVFLGFDGVAGAIRGDGNTFSSNLVGTDASGNVPGKQTDPDLICSPVDWLGGGGISMEGNDHVIADNVFAGLRQQIFSMSTQPDAIRVTGRGHTVERNQIGVDMAGTDVGVCGRGVFMSDSPKNVTISANVIVNPGLSGISLNGPLYDANELRSNVIRQARAWTEVEGNPKPEDAIQVGPLLPDSLQQFAPARITGINGTAVTGTSGAGSPCPNCTIELFLDDTDGIVEALQSLAVVTADAQGNWQATLPKPLAEDEGLRTTSTSSKFNTIPGLSAGTTTGLSILTIEREPPAYLPVILNQ